MSRWHRTIIHGQVSSLLRVLSAAPLGSILGPLLFIIHISSAPRVTDARATVQLYADDMMCYRAIDDVANVIQLVYMPGRLNTS